MSTNCIRCGVAPRTDIDLKCDYCRKGLPLNFVIEIGLLRRLEKTAREAYTYAAIFRKVSDDNRTEDDHFRFICSNDDLHRELITLDEFRKATK